MQIGERIRWLRTQQCMTIATLADKVGVTRQTISRYETGAIEDIPKNKLESIAAALDVTIDYLQGWTIESQLDSLAVDIQRHKELLETAQSDNERAEIQQSISVMEESYEDLHLAMRLQNTTTRNQKTYKPGTIGSKVKEWHSDRKSSLKMPIDSWLLLALKGMAADANRSIVDEIENALYEYVMYAIEDEVNRQDGIINSRGCSSGTD